MRPSAEDRTALQALAREITSSARTRDSLIREAVALSRLLEGLTGLSPETQPDIGANQTTTGAGLAISPIKAAHCAREPLRTITFIRGLAAAIEQARRPDRPVRVLYAGCGPFATLALPLMTLFGPQTSFTLLDIHAASLDCARSLVEGFGLASSVSRYVLDDACALRLDAAQLPDVIVSETMNASLRSEPQVAIMRHLAAQAPAALLVPESVTVEACLLRPGKELPPPLEGPDAQPQPAQRERIPLGPVFRLDREAIAAWKKEGSLLPAGAVQIPAELPDRMQARLLTKITAFGPHRLDDYESSLNLPQHLPGKPALAGGEHLQFAYRISEAPGLMLVPAA